MGFSNCFLVKWAKFFVFPYFFPADVGRILERRPVTGPLRTTDCASAEITGAKSVHTKALYNIVTVPRN